MYQFLLLCTILYQFLKDFGFDANNVPFFNVPTVLFTGPFLTLYAMSPFWDPGSVKIQIQTLHMQHFFLCGLGTKGLVNG